MLGRLTVTMLCLLCATGAPGCRGPAAEDSGAGSPAELPVVRAEVMSVQPTVWPSIVRTQGSLVADEVAVIGAKVPGRVAEVHVDLGDVVPAGAVLATLEQEEFRLEVAQSEAQLAQVRAAVGLLPGDPLSALDPESSPPVREAKAVWAEALARSERIGRLRALSGTSETEYQQAIAAEGVAEARYASALNGVNESIALIGVREAELSLARQRLADSVIHAPFEGEIQQRHVAPGTFVQVGQALLTVVRTNPLRFRGMVPERHAHRLAPGQQVRLLVESATEPRVVTITRISPSVDELSRALLFEAVVENADARLRTGQFAEAEVVLDPEARSLIVPHSAVVEFAGTEKVWMVVDGACREQVVQTGQRRADGVEILNGLAAGDVILQEGREGRVARIGPVRTEAVPPELTATAQTVHAARPIPRLRAGSETTGESAEAAGGQ